MIYPVITDNKKRGEWAEALFIAHALSRGWEVFTEQGDSSSYDVIISKGNTMRTIQIKSTFGINQTRSSWTVSRGSKKKIPYHSGLDFFALYCNHSDVWRFIRPSQIAGRTTFSIRHDDNKTKQNWHELENNTNSSKIS